MRTIALGLDGGGTKVLAEAAEQEGVTVGHGASGPCNIASMPLAEALGNALTAANQALSEADASADDVAALCAGVAGASFGARRTEFLAELQAYFPRAIVTVEPDYAIALTGATGGAPGMIVIAGTGSAAYGENALGQSHKTGAYGYLIDDGGSGYGVGRAALAAALRAADGTGEATTLTKRLCSALSLIDLGEIIPGVYGGSIDRMTIASLARVVSDAAREDNDTVACALLMRAGGTLAQLTHSITQRLFPDGVTPFPVVPIGGLWNAGGILTDVFQRSLHRFAPRALFATALKTPVAGATRRALQAISQRRG